MRLIEQRVIVFVADAKGCYNVEVRGLLKKGRILKTHKTTIFFGMCIMSSQKIRDGYVILHRARRRVLDDGRRRDR
jgi:hypothetical protein